MTKEQINRVAACSSGTIAIALDTHLYKDVDAFTQWLYRPLISKNRSIINKDILWGELAAWGDNLLIALKNAVICYKKYYLNRSTISISPVAFFPAKKKSMS